MCRLGPSIALAMALVLGSTAVTATDPPVAEPQMVGSVDAGKLSVIDATAVGDAFAFLGTRGREPLSLRWFDADADRERKLSVVRSGEMPRELVAAPGGIVFTGYRERQGTEPWRSDGTRAGTTLIREIHTGRQLANCAPPLAGCPTFPAGSDPWSLVDFRGRTYFLANHPAFGRELWRTNGTRKGTRLIRDIQPGPAAGVGLGESSPVVYRDHLYFVADDGRHGYELWRTDGTRDGTRMVRDIAPGDAAAWWFTPVVAGDLLYFLAKRRGEGSELWRTDGSARGTRLVRDIRSGPRTSDPMDLTAVGGTLFFTAMDREHGRELWRTDGTRRGTELVADLTPGPESSALTDLVALGDTLYLTRGGLSDETGPGGELWRLSDSTGVLQPVCGNDDDPVVLRHSWAEFPTHATRDQRLFTTADDGVHGNELWMIDGSTGVAELVADVRPGAAGSDPEWLTLAEATLYFTADDGEHGRQLWALSLPDGPEGEAIR